MQTNGTGYLLLRLFMSDQCSLKQTMRNKRLSASEIETISKALRCLYMPWPMFKLLTGRNNQLKMKILPTQVSDMFCRFK